ncbi:hypothetical protein HPB50_010333 [Hyalomma asiaticum]|uniref:Uncharacterized protein n=1 Tax=Hyalomma asiaticum TaxID=266040 RepID=A0ACB7SMK8_HYAAI|nr:hypothetical protein HPB50_010333 [Hyalomma asiaticum]
MVHTSYMSWNGCGANVQWSAVVTEASSGHQISQWQGQRVSDYVSHCYSDEVGPGSLVDGSADLASGNMNSSGRAVEWRTRLRNHDADRPYKCRMCPRSFTQSSHLKRHCLSHTGQLPFKCNFCGKRFARSDNCRTHEKSHMRAIGRL